MPFSFPSQAELRRAPFAARHGANFVQVECAYGVFRLTVWTPERYSASFSSYPQVRAWAEHFLSLSL